MGKGAHLGEFEELVLLAVAGLTEGAHGAAIHQAILEASGRDVSLPSVYVTLSRLEKKGHVTAAVEIGGDERGGRPRKTFRLTDSAVTEVTAARRMRDRLWSDIEFGPARAGDLT